MVKCTSGFESVQGRRWSMEDAHVVEDDLSKTFEDIELFKNKPCSYYGVYDGHGGQQAAQVVAELLHVNLIKDEKFSEENYEEAITNSFLKTDKQVIERGKAEGWCNGTTVVITAVIDDDLYLGNVGDSECVIGRKKNDVYEPELVSKKHKPSDKEEKERIEAAGGQVIFGRILASLAVARALGDADYKSPDNKSNGNFVSAEPYLNKVKLSSGNFIFPSFSYGICIIDCEFMVVACDGLWDKLTYQDAVDFIGNCKNNDKNPIETSELLVKEALDRGSLDNITVIVVYFEH